jgi:hypothetical protein
MCLTKALGPIGQGPHPVDGHSRTHAWSLPSRYRLPRLPLEACQPGAGGLLVRRQQRRYGPFTQAGISFGACVGVTAVALVFACFAALLAAGLISPASASDPPNPGDGWAAAGFFVVIAASFAVTAVITTRRQLQEHPPPAQQPTEAG